MKTNTLSYSIKWTTSDHHGAVYPYVADMYHSLPSSFYKTMREWCKENIGEQGGIGADVDAKWFHHWQHNIFKFRHETDRFMFILQFTGEFTC